MQSYMRVRRERGVEKTRHKEILDTVDWELNPAILAFRCQRAVTMCHWLVPLAEHVLNAI